LRDATGLDFGDRSWICNAVLIWPVMVIHLLVDELSAYTGAIVHILYRLSHNGPKAR